MMESFNIPSHVDVELSKIKQDSKRFEMFAILEDPVANHEDRLTLARFMLGTAGYDAEPLLEIIHHLNHWLDYSTNMTYAQVMSVSKWLGRSAASSSCVVDVVPSSGNNDISNKVFFAKLSFPQKESVNTTDGRLKRSLKSFEPHICLDTIGRKSHCYHKKCGSCSHLEGSAVLL